MNSWKSPVVDHPGIALAKEMGRVSLSAADVAGALCVPIAFVEDILAGRKAIAFGMASRLARLTGRRTDFWLRRQGRFEGRYNDRDWRMRALDDR
ncbi:MAG TPA: transcriptional regulator [Patescibacteria group bacterium]|nr:transcriptional regulator [Patescibacteria group bacterium]